MGKRIEWLAVLRGLNILLVVMFHVQLIDMSTGENHAFCNEITSFFTPIRIPLFIFISGGLLYLSRIRKEWEIKKLYRDKLKRIMIPFVFFVTIYFFIKALMNSVVKTKVDLSIHYFLESFLLFENHPSAPLWFLATLMILMLMYPLFKYVCKKDVYMLSFFIFTICIYFFDLSSYERFNYFYLLYLNKYLVFFYLGIFFFKYETYKYMNNIFVFLLLLFLYTLTFIYDIDLLTSVLGILTMTSLCIIVSRYLPSLFSSFRDYIYQVYLMSFIFQGFVELVLWKKMFYNESLFIVFYILNVAFGIYGPVIISKIIKRTNNNILSLCFGIPLSTTFQRDR